MLRKSNQHSRLNRSNLLNQSDNRDVTQTLHESRLNLREDSNKLMHIIKLVSIILVIVLILYYLGTPKFGNIFNIRKYIQRAKDYTKEKKDQYSKANQSATETQNKEGFWHNWFNHDCKLCQLEKNEMQMAPSVSKNLNRPSQIFVPKSQRGNFNLDKALNDLLSDNSDIDNFDATPMIDSFNRYVGYGSINPQSGDNEKKQVQQNLNEDKNRYQQPKKLLDDEYLMKLRKLARDLTASNENQISKKKLLTQYREEIFNNLSKLKDCRQRLLSIKDNYDQEEYKIKGLQAELNDLLQQLQQIENQLKQRGAPEDRSLLDKLNDIERQITSIQNKLQGLPVLERRIQEKIALKLSLNNKNNENQDKIRDYQNRLDGAKLNKVNAQNQLRMLNQNLELKQQYTQIVEQNLKIAHDNFEIVRYTKELFNPNSSIDELKKIHSQNIENQKIFLKKIKDYEQRVNNIEDGYEIVAESKMERSNYEQDFQDNERTYHEIESKYMELKKIIEDYEHRKLQFEMHQTKKKQHEDQIAEIQKKIRDFQRQLNEANNNIKMYGDYIDQLNNEIRSNNQNINHIDIYISENQPNREALESQLALLLQEKQSLSDTLGVRRNQYEQENRVQRQQYNDLQKRIYDLRNQIKDHDYNLKGRKNDLRNQVERCSGLKVNQDNLKNYLNYLQVDQTKDIDSIEKQKNELHRMLSELNNF